MAIPKIASETLHLLVFILARKLFALEIEEIVEIIEFKRLTKIPRQLPFVEGVINYKGRVVPVINLRKRLEVPASVPGAGSTTLLFQPSSSRWVVGLVVDAAASVVTVEKETLLEPPPKVFGIKVEFIKGIANLEGRPVIWLDMAKLLSSLDEVTLVV